MKIIADANIPFVTECFCSIGEVEVVSGREITAQAVADADCLLVRSVTRVDSDLLANSKVQFAATATIGFDHIDVDFLRNRDIGFASAPGSNANSVAEYVVAALLEVGQKHNFNLQDKSIGIIGAGNVGSKVAQKTAALGMKVYLNDPPLQRKTKDAKYLPLKSLLDCDIITLHTPLTFEGIDKTCHLADEKFFKSLKAGCTFINTSRGAVVDTAALKGTVKSARLQATVLDVWENEPDIDTGLLEMVDIGTAHIAGYSLDGKISGTIMIYKAVCKYFGLEAEFDTESFLPEPVVGQLKINPQPMGQQSLLSSIVKELYDIKKDDLALRAALNMPTGKKCALFGRLRENYPVRREFQNTQIVLESSCEKFLEKLKGIGFNLSNEQAK